jgi:hypothetical protein
MQQHYHKNIDLSSALSEGAGRHWNAFSNEESISAATTYDLVGSS